MKVLLINGSPHKEGNTFLALNEVAKTLNVLSIETEMAWIGVKPIRGCMACNQCADGSGHCVFGDDLCNVMIDHLAAADGLVVGTPTYYGTPNGTLLNLLHRMFYAGPQSANKPAAAVAVCRRGGATAAFQSLQMPFQMLNMPLVTSQYWNIVYGCAPGEARLDAEGLQTMRQLGRNMAWMLQSLRGLAAPASEPPQATNMIR